jgi:hypothetical protein
VARIVIGDVGSEAAVPAAAIWPRISAFTVAVNDAGSSRPSRLTVLKPANAKVTV